MSRRDREIGRLEQLVVQATWMAIGYPIVAFIVVLDLNDSKTGSITELIIGLGFIGAAVLCWWLRISLKRMIAKNEVKK